MYVCHSLSSNVIVVRRNKDRQNAGLGEDQQRPSSGGWSGGVFSGIVISILIITIYKGIPSKSVDYTAFDASLVFEHTTKLLDFEPLRLPSC
jgi:hypothetical protein